MLDLATLQRRFQTYILGGENQIQVEIDSSKVKHGVDRLDIYAQMYVLRLQEALDMSFPTLKEVMGIENFEAMLKSYIAANPSEYFTISYYAEKLPHYLTHTLPYARCAYYGEIAELEWAILSVVDAPNAPIATVADLQAIAPDEWPALKFEFHPSCRLLSLKFNVDELWYAHDQQQALPEIMRFDEARSHLLWRYDFQPFHQAYDGPAQAMLLHAYEGYTFARICEALCDFLPEDEVAAFAIQNLGGWLNSQIISRLA